MCGEGRTPNSQFLPENTWGQTNRRRLSKRTIQLCGSPVEMSKLSRRFSTTGRMTAAPISAVGTMARSNRRTWPVTTATANTTIPSRSEEHTSELQSLAYLVCRLLLEQKNIQAEP